MIKNFLNADNIKKLFDIVRNYLYCASIAAILLSYNERHDWFNSIFSGTIDVCAICLAIVLVFLFLLNTWNNYVTVKDLTVGLEIAPKGKEINFKIGIGFFLTLVFSVGFVYIFLLQVDIFIKNLS